MATPECQQFVSELEAERDGAFDFSNCIRNMALARIGGPSPKLRSTGTTIVATTYKGGLVMGADSRATAGNIIADKHCEKVHYLTESIYACGAGTAADLDQVCKMLSANLKLFEVQTGRKARVITALRMAKQHLFNYMGYVGAYLLIGGVDPSGPHLYECSANGTTMAKPYAAMGSGSYAAISVLERDFKVGMTEEAAEELVQRALHAGMHGDNASGNSLNLVIMTPAKTTFKGPIVPDFCKKPDPVDLDYKFKFGSTKIVKQKTIKYDIVESMDGNSRRMHLLRMSMIKFRRMASYESEHRMTEENLELGLLRLIVHSGWSDAIRATFDSLFPDGARPAHPEAVAELSVYKCLELKDQKGQCLICLEPWEDANEGETATKMPCNHLFHTKCIKLWFEKTNTCPCCRHEIRSSNEDYEEYKRIQKRKTERQADLDELHNSMFS